MAEVTIVGENLSGLGQTLKSLMDANLSKAEIWDDVKKIRGTLVVRETGAEVAVTLFFHEGEIRVQDGAIANPSARLEAGFEELCEVVSGQIGPIKALFKGKIRARGNLLKLLKMAKAIICKETDS